MGLRGKSQPTQDYLIFVRSAICRNALALYSPKQIAKHILKISVKEKAAQKGKGPRTALHIPPRERKTTHILIMSDCIAWISAVT